MNLEFFNSQKTDGVPTATLFKVYCYRMKSGVKEKQIWYECEDNATGQGIAWSPNKITCIQKSQKLGYIVENLDRPVLKFYKAKV